MSIYVGTTADGSDMKEAPGMYVSPCGRYWRNDSFNIHKIDTTPAQKVIPKGCKEYYFGHHPDEQWSCIAINEKSARKKYDKWLIKQ